MRKSKVALYVLYATLFLNTGGFGLIFPILPELLIQYGSSALGMGILVIGHGLMQFLSAPYWGTLSDRMGRKRILVVGLAGSMLSFVLMGFSEHFWMLFVARTFGGLLSAATVPTAHAYVADVTTKEERGGAMSSLGAAMSLGMIGGPALGGVLSFLGIQAVFFAAGGLMGATALMAVLLLQEPHRERTAKEAETGRAGRPSSLESIRIAIGLPFRLFFFLAMGTAMGQTTLFTLAGFYIHAKLGGSAVETAFVYIAMGIARATVQGVLVGRMMKSFGVERTILVGLGMGIAGFGFLILSATLSQVLAATLFFSGATACLQPTINAAISRRTILPQGITMGIQSAFFTMGKMMGPMLGGLVFSLHYEAPFVVAALVYTLMLVFAVRTFGAGPFGVPSSAPRPPQAAAQSGTGD